MAGIFEDTNPRPLREMLRLIESKDCALPDFQRDFVWDPNATQELIISIACNYPAGSLLRIRNTRDYFACREFQGAPALNGSRPNFLILDGQQRLTSLYQAFFGVGDHHYFLNLKGLLEGEDIEECFFHERSNTKKAHHLENLDVQARELVLPLQVLREGQGGFTTWMLEITRHLEDSSERMALQDRLMEINKQWIVTIDQYQFPVVTLSEETTADAICTIFETLNRTGVQLSPFELLTARFWPKGVNLRHLWEKAITDHPVIQDFRIDPYYLLQIVSLASRRNPSSTRKYILELEASAINEWWDRSVEGLVHALELLREECGVISPRWLPYGTMINPLAAVNARSNLGRSPEQGVARIKLKRWFWCSVFGQAYDSAANTQAARDVVQLTEWLEGGELPETVRDFQFDPRILRETTSRQRGLYSGIFCLVFRGAPIDFYSGATLHRDLMIENKVDDHHIFPNAFLGRLEVPQRERDCVLNRTLIDRTTNQMISDRPPSSYMTEIRHAFGDGEFRRLLESHHLPHDADSPIWRDDFEAFLQWRQDALWQQIQDVTGLEEASDLIEDEISA